MGRRVLANGKAVATTTSDHIARAILPDMRLQGQVPVPRKNWVESEKLAANRTTNTKFDGGWVWKQDSKCGPPSKAQPDDHLPGIANGGFVDGCAEALPGQGAPTVFVEGLKAICKDHLTFQNHKNTLGMIVNAEELAAYLAEPMDLEGEAADAEKVKKKAKGTTTGDAGEDEEARKKKEEGDNTKTTDDVHPDCALETFEIWDGEKRKNNDKFVLEAISDSTIRLVAKGKFCADHAGFDFGGKKSKGTETSSSLRDIGLPEGLLLHKWWREVRVICEAHGKQITGTVAVCSNLKWELAIGEDTSNDSMRREGYRNQLSRRVLNLREKVKPYFKALERKLPFKVPFADFKYLEGSTKVAAAWKEEKDWQCWCNYSASGEMLILEASLKWEIKIVDWLLRAGGPVGVAIEKVIDAIEFLTGTDLSLLKLEIKFGGKLSTSLTGTICIDRFSSVKSGSIELKGGAEIYLSATLKLNFLEKIEGSMGGKGTIGLEASGKLKLSTACALDFGVAFKGFTLKFNMGIKIKLGWLERFIPSWVTEALHRAVDGDLNSKSTGLTIGKEWTLVDGWGKFDVFKTTFALN